MPNKCILIVLDGLGDRSFPELGGKTPLQAARTPVMDRMAARGGLGLYHAARPGLALPSESAHFFMFGYDPHEFPGRGALEALGAGVPLKEGEVAVLCHLAETREDGGTLRMVRDDPNIGPEESRELMESIKEYEHAGTRLRLYWTRKRYGILVLDGDVAPFVTDTDPMRDNAAMIEAAPLEEYAADPAARNTASCLKAYLTRAYRRLDSHRLNRQRKKKGQPPANALVTQRAGRLTGLRSMKERYGLRGVSISSGLIYWGLSTLLGMEHVKAKSGGGAGEDLAGCLSTALSLIGDFDFFHVHSKAPDEASDLKDPQKKMEIIEDLDRGLGRVIPGIIEDPDILLVLCSDHSTPSGGPLIHSGEPVPLLFCGEGVRRDNVAAFDEVSAAAGSLGPVRGKELMYLVLNYLDRIKLSGLMDTPVDQCYWPGESEPFRLV